MELPTPREMANELLNNSSLTEDQANTIAAELYQPLKGNIENLQKTMLRLTACLAVELGASTVKSIIEDIKYPK